MTGKAAKAGKAQDAELKEFRREIALYKEKVLDLESEIRRLRKKMDEYEDGQTGRGNAKPAGHAR
jgi:predicted nuclease with TOPRIM domain